MMNNGMMQGMGIGRGGIMVPGQAQQNGMPNGMGGTMAGGMVGGMGGSMGGPHRSFNPQMQPQPQQQQAQIQKHILTRLRAQTNRPGWQSVCNIALRVQYTFQL